MNTNSFSAVDLFNANILLYPPLLWISSATMILCLFSLVMVAVFNSPDVLGDILAADHDRGGGVVVAFRANCWGGLSRAYAAISNGYALLDYSGGCSGGGYELGNFIEPSRQLLALAGVSSLEAVWAGKSSGQQVPWAITVVKWRSCSLLVLQGVRND